MSKEIVLNVRKLKRNYRVETTNNKYKFSEETIIKYSIFKGREFSEEEIKLILLEEEKNLLLNKAINFLSYQARSENEIRKYLLSKEATEPQADTIVQEIKELGYLNDEELANSLLDYLQRTGKGPRVLEEKLVQKGISEDLIKKVLTKYSNSLEEEVLENALVKVSSRYKKYPLNKQRNLLYQKFLRDGFSPDILANLIKKMELVDESDSQLSLEIEKLLQNYDQLDYKSKSLIINKLINKGYDYAKILEKLKYFE